MKNTKKKKRYVYQYLSKVHKINKVDLPERKCLGNRYDLSCNRMFKPRCKTNFLCELCTEYNETHNLGE